MNSKPHSQESEEAGGSAYGGIAGMIHVAPKFDSGHEEASQSRAPRTPATKTVATLSTAIQVVLGGVLGLIPFLGGWFWFLNEMSNRRASSKADLILGFLTSGFLTVAVVLAVQAIMTAILIYMKKQIASVCIWLVYVPIGMILLF